MKIMYLLSMDFNLFCAVHADVSADKLNLKERLERGQLRIYIFIIHQIFSLARDWSKRVTWANIPQLKLGNIRGYSPIFKTDG